MLSPLHEHRHFGFMNQANSKGSTKTWGVTLRGCSRMQSSMQSIAGIPAHRTCRDASSHHVVCVISWQSWKQDFITQEGAEGEQNGTK